MLRMLEKYYDCFVTNHWMYEVSDLVRETFMKILKVCFVASKMVVMVMDDQNHIKKETNIVRTDASLQTDYKDLF